MAESSSSSILNVLVVASTLESLEPLPPDDESNEPFLLLNWNLYCLEADFNILGDISIISIGIPIVVFLYDIGIYLLVASKKGDCKDPNKGFLTILAPNMYDTLGCNRMSSIGGLLLGL